MQYFQNCVNRTGLIRCWIPVNSDFSSLDGFCDRFPKIVLFLLCFRRCQIQFCCISSPNLLRWNFQWVVSMKIFVLFFFFSQFVKNDDNFAIFMRWLFQQIRVLNWFTYSLIYNLVLDTNITLIDGLLCWLMEKLEYSMIEFVKLKFLLTFFLR